MSKDSTSFDLVRNHVLRNLDADALSRVLNHLEPVRLRSRTVLHHAGGKIGYFYFIESGAVSMMTGMADGANAEVGMVGREGMIGGPLLIGKETANLEAFVQVAGEARRISASAFRHVLETMPTLREALLRCAYIFQTQVALVAACNARHTMERRLARWILTTGDRTENDEFAATQEGMARMLAVQRPGVTLALQRLRSSGEVHSCHGIMRIVDRPALEARSCECYFRMRDLPFDV